MTKTAQDGFFDDFASDALDSYLRQIGKIEPLAPEEQKRACARFEELTAKLGKSMAAFGFTAGEYLRLLQQINAGEIDAADLFLPSSLQQCGGTAQLMGALDLWEKEITAMEKRNREYFNNGALAGHHRQEMCELLSRYQLGSNLVREQLEVLQCYVAMLDEKFDLIADNFELKNCSDNPDIRNLVTGKLRMSLEELAPALHELSLLLKDIHELRNKLLESNLRLVISIAQRYRNRGVHLNDLIQEGNLGLLRALERFDFKLGYQFSTYASWWIKHNIGRVIAAQSRVIRLPEHMIKAISDINRAEQRFIQLKGREPESAELAKELELPEARVSAIRKMAMQAVSLQAPVGNGDEGSVLEDIVADNGSFAPEHDFARKILYDRLYAMLRSLPEREQQIIIMRFGFFGQPCMPLTEISRRFNLTRERVRQLEIKIIATLRSPEKLKFIDGCFQPDDLS